MVRVSRVIGSARNTGFHGTTTQEKNLSFGKHNPTLRQTWPRVGPEAAMCVRKISAQCVLQFTPSLAAGCVLHRPVSRVIHCSELYFQVLFREVLISETSLCVRIYILGFLGSEVSLHCHGSHRLPGRRVGRPESSEDSAGGSAGCTHRRQLTPGTGKPESLFKPSTAGAGPPFATVSCGGD